MTDRVAERVVRAANGDDDAFASLMEQYRGMAFGYAFGTVRDRWLAEDATQIAFIEAYQNLGSIRDPARFGAWLRGILRYTCLRLMRDQHSWVSIEANPSLHLAVAHPAEDDHRETLDRFLDALAQLPERERTVAALYYIDGGSHSEVARFLGLTTSMVNNRLRRARARLREQGVFPMGEHETRKPTTGHLSPINTGFIDVRIDGVRPALLDTVTFERGAGPVALVSQYVSDDVVRLLPIDGSEIAGSTNSVTLRSEARRSTASLEMIQTLVQGLHRDGNNRRVDTGIKAVDLFAPFVDSGVIAIVGDSHIGKLVLVEEIVHRLDGAASLTLLVFLASPDESGTVKPAEVRTGRSIEVLYLPVPDASSRALSAPLEHCDAVIALSQDLSVAGIYPAVDITRSRSGIPDGELVAKARSLAGNTDVIRRFATQPFYVAESYTGTPGTTVSVDAATRELATLVENVGEVP